MGQVPLNEAGSAVIQTAPSTSERSFIIKKASYQKGETPEHLEQYSGQVSDLPRKCEGRTGSNYTACLRSEAAKMGL